MRRTLRAALAAIVIGAASTQVEAQAPGAAPDAKNMALVGFNDLQARSAYQPLVHEQNGRWIAYVGHHGGTAAVPKPSNPLTGQPEFNGTSIIDVTDPSAPKYLVPHSRRGRPGRERRRADGARVRRQRLPQGDPNKFYLLRVFGNSAHEMWDVTDPATPKRLSQHRRPSRERTRTAGNATPASRISFPGVPAGARGA